MMRGAGCPDAEFTLLSLTQSNITKNVYGLSSMEALFRRISRLTIAGSGEWLEALGKDRMTGNSI